MIITDGIATVVDHNNYNLTRKEAVDRLKSKQSMIAVEYPDFTQEHIQNMYPEPVILDWHNYFEKSEEELMEELRIYEQFGTMNYK